MTMRNNVYIHQSSIVSDEVLIGDNTKIWQFCNLLPGCRIGSNCKIGMNVYMENVIIGDRVTIKNNISLYSGITIEDDVFLGPNCVFTNVINPRAFISRKEEFKNTLVKKGASIGANATIICDVTIGEYALIGAGAVVTHDVPPYTCVVGNPAKEIYKVCECGNKLSKTKTGWLCSICNKEFSIGCK